MARRSKTAMDVLLKEVNLEWLIVMTTIMGFAGVFCYVMFFLFDLEINPFLPAGTLWLMVGGYGFCKVIARDLFGVKIK